MFKIHIQFFKAFKCDADCSSPSCSSQSRLLTTDSCQISSTETHCSKEASTTQFQQTVGQQLQSVEEEKTNRYLHDLDNEHEVACEKASSTKLQPECRSAPETTKAGNCDAGASEDTQKSDEAVYAASDPFFATHMRTSTTSAIIRVTETLRGKVTSTITTSSLSTSTTASQSNTTPKVTVANTLKENSLHLKRQKKLPGSSKSTEASRPKRAETTKPRNAAAAAAARDADSRKQWNTPISVRHSQPGIIRKIIVRDTTVFFKLTFSNFQV